MDKIRAKGLDNSLYCSGCGACVAVCPCNALKIERNEFGFFSAKLDPALCINCGLCKKVCVIDSDCQTGVNVNSSFKIICRTKNEELYKRAASGGFASTVYQFALSNGIPFVGTLYNPLTNQVEYTIGHSEKDIMKFSGSKYLQPFSGDIISRILSSDMQAIICGLPCFIYGFRRAAKIKHRESDFLFIDLCCHGTISYDFWDKFRVENFNHEMITDISFRSHKDSPSQYTLKIKSNNFAYSQNRKQSIFYKAFDDSYLISDACYKCQINQSLSFSDIRIGDFYLDDNNFFYSKAFILTEKGERFWEKISSRFESFELSDNLPNRTGRRSNLLAIRKIGFDALNMGKTTRQVVRICRKKESIKVRLVRLIEEHKILQLIYHIVKRTI